MRKVFKFGGASIKDSKNIINVGKILIDSKEDNLVVVFSAIGKVTNMFEKVIENYFQGDKIYLSQLQEIKLLHANIVSDLFNNNELIFQELDNIFLEISLILSQDITFDFSYYYDQVVSFGEILSSTIMSRYLVSIGFSHSFIDARNIICTDKQHRNAKINWISTNKAINENISLNNIVTQGFIASSEGITTTLGREGSDFTAAIIGNALDVEEVVIWKDVPGMMNADPEYFPDAKVFQELSFDEAIELAFYGAKVIHPKTIQPLKDKNIPLKIRSFINTNLSGTTIKEQAVPNRMPSYIIKHNQILLSISDTSLSFIVENHISRIFHLLSLHSIRVNMLQNSAVSFSVCIDNEKYKVPDLISDLQKDFKVYYNKNLSLFTIRNYTEEIVEDLIKENTIILEQKSRNTMQVVTTSSN